MAGNLNEHQYYERLLICGLCLEAVPWLSPGPVYAPRGGVKTGFLPVSLRGRGLN